MITGGRTFVRRPSGPSDHALPPPFPLAPDVRLARDEERGLLPTWVEPAGCPPHQSDAVDRGPFAAGTREGSNGDGVALAVVERSWEGRHGKDPAEWVEHGERTLATLRDRAPRCHVEHFSSVEDAEREQIPEAIGRAIDWLVRQEEKPKVLLIELQTFLSVGQVEGAATDFALAPGGRLAAGPVDADPLVAQLIRAAFVLGIVVVIPAGNGRLDLARCKTADLQNPLQSDNHASIRVGAAGPSGAPLKSSNHGRGVDVYGPGVGVRARLEESWGGTSAAAAAVAAWVARLWSANPTLDAAAIKAQLLQNRSRLT